jgi:hypothetical protein
MTMDTFLTLDRHRFLKVAAALCVLSVLAYIWHEPPVTPNGGTWLGYTLGTIGALLILWLMAFGLRKRAYRSSLGTLRGWLSAHVWLGLALVVVATLHAGFQFGWNVHTLAYALTVFVVGSGLWGVTLYSRHPALMGGLLGGRTLQQHGETLAEIDDECRRLAAGAPERVRAIIASSADATILRGLRERLSGRARACATRDAVRALEALALEGDRTVRELYALQVRRLQTLEGIRRFVRLKSITEWWLLLHVPGSLALLAVLIAHVVSVFFYW